MIESRRERSGAAAPLPPRTMFPFGTSAALEELALTGREVADVSPSPMVKAMALEGVSSEVVLLVTSVMVGAVLANDPVGAVKLMPAAVGTSTVEGMATREMPGPAQATET